MKIISQYFGLRARGAGGYYTFIFFTCLILPQLPFWLVKVNFSIDRPIYNLDLVVAVIIACFYCRFGLFLLAVAWLVDMARATSLMYHFVSPVEFVSTAKFADMIVLRQVLSWNLLLGLLVFALCLLVLTKVVRKSLVWPLVISIFLLYGADLFNGSSQLFGMGLDRFRVAINIAGSPTWNIIQMERQALLQASLSMTEYENPRAFRSMRNWHIANPNGSVLLVLVESMGKPESLAVEDWMIRKIATMRVRQRWNIATSQDDFFGPTTSGELRVLCGLRGSYSGLKPKNESGCLPNKFMLDGFKVSGLHGFHLRMFDRYIWWPRLGLTPWQFNRDGEGKIKTGCNAAFPGVCDDTLLARAVNIVDEPSRFVYALTLDTHLPLPKGVDLPTDLAEICLQQKVDDVACQMVAALGAVLERLEMHLASMKAPPLVVVVGDHSPPFSVTANRVAFNSKQVPLYILTPIASR